MGRSRGPKFSFPIPGRKSHTHIDETISDHTTPMSSRHLDPEWPTHREKPTYSKAQRVLGTTGPPRRLSSNTQSSLQSLPQSPGYMTITVSEASFGSEYTDSAAVENGQLYPPQRPGMVSRPSSNILGNAYHNDGKRGSNGSSISRRLHHQTSNSTMHSYYDPQQSPLSVSQQTSDSSIRDRGLRKGQSSVVATNGYDHHVPSPLSHQTSQEFKKEGRKGKPARLDLSKLFPKPKANNINEHSGALLSPNKMVNSPSAMSTTSDYFPRPMTREPTPVPNPRGHAKLTKASKKQQAPPTQPARPASPVRMYKRDTYDNAKINVRRPPRGIQHWFEGLDEESEEDYEEESTPIHAPIPRKANGSKVAPSGKSSLGRGLQNSEMTPGQTRSPQYGGHMLRKEQVAHNELFAHRLNSPSQFSMQSQSSNKTKESTWSRSNLQDSSVLSISSSESESEGEAPPRNRPNVLKTLDWTDDQDEIIIGRAQAFEMRPRLPTRTPSASKMSMMSTSTNAATIEVMYTPEPYTPNLHFPRGTGTGSRRSSQDRRSSHFRQPSTILENEQFRPKTSGHRPLSPTSSSIYSAQSEPRPRTEQHKLMAVTAEEEALLEMMRQKRATMAKHSFSEGFKKAMMQEQHRQKTPPEGRSPRTSAFLSMETPSASPAQVMTASSRRSAASSTTPFLLPIPSRGRPKHPAQDSSIGTSILRDSSSCDSRTPADLESSRVSPHSRPVLAHQLPPPPEFSQLDPFPSPEPTPTTASVASPTTTDHASPLPSPITPGLRSGEADVSVKVASSEPSCDGEDEVAVLETGIIDPPSGSIKPSSSHESMMSAHQRRRTASSGANVAVIPPAKQSLSSLASLSATSGPTNNDLTPTSDASPFMAPPGVEIPRIPIRSTRRTSTLTLSTLNGQVRSKNSENSLASFRSGSPASTKVEKRGSRIVSAGASAGVGVRTSVVSRGSTPSISSARRESVGLGSAGSRCSVSEDVLAAWGSLGGLRDYNYSAV
ncbi:hypothetical protein CC78DRAFT_346030 [Lojkania enalia]|uniref:Uncharacterized protein n=1 Tax=Lojkania enalia TaxID=147567 RepID=A0A9P4K610_9PLEO|nr:hypothetical protein CC78DRAFT_346030 [Didymosphaeria enalia]